MATIVPFRQRANTRARLRHAHQHHELVRLWRDRLEQGGYCGYVAGVGREFLLLRVIGDGLTDEGLVAIRHRDVTELEAPEAHHHFVEKALAIKQIVPELPAMFPLDTVHDVLAAATSRTPIIGVQVDSEEDTELCYIGRVHATGKDGFQLQEIDPDAHWLRETSLFAWGEVTTLSMGDPYALSLAAVAGAAPPLVRQPGDDGDCHSGKH